MWDRLKPFLPGHRDLQRQRDEAVSARLRAELQCEQAEAARWDAVREREQAEEVRWKAVRARERADEARAQALRERDAMRSALDGLATPTGHSGFDILKALQSRLDQLQRSVNLVAARTPVVARPIRVLFVAHFAQAWMTLEGIYRAMAADPDFEPVVATIDHRFHSDAPFSGEAALSAMLEARHIPHLRWGALAGAEGTMLLTSLAPDVVFLQTHWSDSFPAPLHPRNIGFARTCYVHYGQEICTAGHDEDVLNSEYVLGAWRVFCSSETVHAMYEARSRKGASHVVVTGNPKLEYLHGLRNQAGVWPMRSIPCRFRVLWAVHHSIGDGGSGVFPAVCRDMLAWAQSEPEMEFVVTFHHLFGAAITTCEHMTAKEFEDFLSAWRALPNTGVYDDPDIGPAFAASDALITDGISFPVEYQMVGKPLFGFEASRYDLTEFGAQAFEGVYRVRTVGDVAEMIRRFRAERHDPRAEARNAIRKTLLPHPDGATRRILNEIRNAIFTEPHAVRPVARVSRIRSV